ncbi:unnamed protein product [Prorocentrum cordatum]|uniref:Uncharacterized protein n=1 Tax=Prorocentrum cordatum TaxID=2364126 RepID=A0ABN9WW31_9DINO|nr:unnamed protein product [Polarella glacialis]
MLLPGLLSAFLRARATSRRVGGAGDGHAGPSRRTRTVIPALANDFQFQARYCLVLDGYSSSFAYWEGVVWLRRGLLLLVGAWPNLSRSAEFVLYQVIGVVFLLIHMWTKPFDSRMGEFLDRVEQNGLCLFLLLVSSVQVLLIAEGEGALLPVLLCAASFALALLLSEVGGSEQWVLLARFEDAPPTVGLLVFCWASGPEEQRAAFFAVLLAAVALCALFALWVVLGVLAQLQKALSELFERQRNFEAKHLEGEPRPESCGCLGAGEEQVQQPAPGRGGRGARSPGRAPGAGQDVAHPGAPVEAARARALRHGHPGAGARAAPRPLPIRHEHVGVRAQAAVEAGALPVGHGERRAVATSLRDGLLHLIFDCDQVVVHGHLLEFLVRVAFARRFEESWWPRAGRCARGAPRGAAGDPPAGGRRRAAPRTGGPWASCWPTRASSSGAWPPTTSSGEHHQDPEERGRGPAREAFALGHVVTAGGGQPSAEARGGASRTCQAVTMSPHALWSTGSRQAGHACGQQISSTAGAIAVERWLKQCRGPPAHKPAPNRVFTSAVAQHTSLSDQTLLARVIVIPPSPPSPPAATI